ncbi:hypothetical protein CCAX7_51290 [Capsulimonas corticalis]|uniref:Uncharacterized protein n=1 Tax=Capsulimonas corticalis TaxID=2219043 RepID=A0A402CPB3_9BACT|nr:hypothetical protein [Capsulimonas corticalis]BDI33078.1 hypothetical protein CCAX7_51290 [Capsulimonas corticalis]
MINAEYGWDDDDDAQDTDETQQDDTENDDSDSSDDSGSYDNNSGDSSSDDNSQDDDSEDAQSDGDGAQALADAAPHEVDAHRNLIGDTLQHLSDQGIDVESLAERAGVDSADVNELTHGDLAGITQYIAQHHPEALQAVSDRYPAAQGILGAITGSGGGFLGRLFGH